MQHINPNIRRKKPHEFDLDYYVSGLKNGDRVALSRAITLAESTQAEKQDIKEELINHAVKTSGKSYRIGVTGVPGAGKSSLIESIGLEFIEQGHKVAVLAVDPTSQQSGGSILGDKTRMNELSKNPAAFIRPSAAGKTLGGVAQATRECIYLCESAGYDIILIETVGVGQSEITVSQLVDFFLLVLVAGAGDELQGMKRGIMEMADSIAINKSDGDNLQRAKMAKTEYARAIGLLPKPLSGFPRKVLTVSAIENQGLDDLRKIFSDYRANAEKEGYWLEKRKQQNLDWLNQGIHDRLVQGFFNRKNVKEELQLLQEKVGNGEISPFKAAELIVRHNQK